MSGKTENGAIPPKPEEFGYLELPRGAGTADWMRQEGFLEKLKRKTKSNPLVPIGLGATVAALTYGLWQMKTGDVAMSQKMMRLRVAAQGFTVLALLGGVVYETYTNPEKKNPKLAQVEPK